jgi:REP element-mobilizing transposase RayT
MNTPKRKSTRLFGYDYSQNGAYFITICTTSRTHILGTVAVGGGVPDAPCMEKPDNVGGGVLDAPHALHNTTYVKLSEHGIIVTDVLTEMLTFYKNIFLPCFVVMPNHIHCILIIEHNGDGASATLNGMLRMPKNGASGTPPPTKPTPANATIPAFLSTFKRFTNKRIGSNIWQRSYYEHIIRDEQDFMRHLEYIENNPAKWAEDEYYVEQ